MVQLSEDLSTFSNVVKWIEETVLPEIRSTYDEAGEVPFCGIIFQAMSVSGDIYTKITPNPLMFGSLEAIDDENKAEFVEGLTDLLYQTASSGILIVLPSIVKETDDPEECVIASLEHKGGNRIYVAKVEDGKLTEFKPTDIKWGEDSAFYRLLPLTGMN